MHRPRIFISHSSKNPTTERFRSELARRLREADYRVLLDKDELRLSQDWRSTLNAWIGGCDAAVLLLSQEALASRYVAYEVSVLAYRHRSEKDRFKLIPVYLPPVTGSQVDASPLAPARVADVQGLSSHVPQDEAIRRVLEYLESHVPSPSVAERHARRLGGVLAKVDDVELETVALKIGAELEPWTPGLQLPMKVAMGLMAVGVERATLGVRVFRSRLKGISSSLEEVMALIATSWVDCRSAAEIVKSEANAGMLALNGSDPRTAWLYVTGSCDLPVSDSWRVVQVDGVVGSGGLDELKTQVRSALAHRLDVPLEEVGETVRAITDSREPIFVALPLLGLAHLEFLTKLRAEFPNVTFFFLMGSELLPDELAQRAGITVLHPLLEPGIEQPFWLIYDKSLKVLRIP